MKIDADISDEDLVLLVQKDADAAAFSEIVNRHTHYLYRIVWRTYPDRHEAEDIVQDVFFEVLDQAKPL